MGPKEFSRKSQFSLPSARLKGVEISAMVADFRSLGPIRSTNMGPRMFVCTLFNALRPQASNAPRMNLLRHMQHSIFLKKQCLDQILRVTLGNALVDISASLAKNQDF